MRRFTAFLTTASVVTMLSFSGGAALAADNGKISHRHGPRGCDRKAEVSHRGGPGCGKRKDRRGGDLGRRARR